MEKSAGPKGVSKESVAPSPCLKSLNLICSLFDQIEPRSYLTLKYESKNI